MPLRPALPFARYSGSNDRARADPRPVRLYRLVCDRSRSKPETVTQLTSVAVPGERSAAAAEESPSVQDQTVDVQYRHGGHKKNTTGIVMHRFGLGPDHSDPSAVCVFQFLRLTSRSGRLSVQ